MFFITDIFYNLYIIIYIIKKLNFFTNLMDGKYNNLIMSEQQLGKISNISMKDFRKQNHLSLKDALEKQPIVSDYRNAFFVSLDYETLFFVYDFISE